MALEWVDCDFCGGSWTTPLFMLRDLKLGLPGEFRLVRCERCGLLYMNPRPTWNILQEHYPANYGSFQFNFSQRAWYGIIRRCKIVSTYQRSGRLLDVGCSIGTFLKKMGEFGSWELYGVEPVFIAAQFARTRFNLNIFQGTLSESCFPSEFFDVVTWWDALEHVPDPSTCLNETVRVLKPGGWLFVQTPDPNSWEARLFGSYWVGYDAPRHLFMFPRIVLLRKLEEIGFKVVQVGSFAGNASTVCKSIGHWLRSRHQEMLGNLLLRLADSSITQIAAAPFYVLLRYLDLTSSVLYIAQKLYQ